MADKEWTFAKLEEDDLELVEAAERTLSADVVMVYRTGDAAPVDARVLEADDLEPATLDESELECLQGMEERMGAVAVAYHRATD
jgi:hypothetical protein